MVLLASIALTGAQTSGVQWERTYGGSSHDFASVVRATSDGGCILGGYSYSEASPNKASASHESGDYWVIKLDATGNKQWDQSFGGTKFDGIKALQQTGDGGYILAGTSFSAASGNKSSDGFGSGDYWIVKLNANGNKQWERSYGGTDLDAVTCVQQTSDGGFIVGGKSSSNASGNKTSGNHGSGSSDYWIVKMDSSGNRQWEKSYGGSDDDELNSLQQTSDGGFILGGTSCSGSSGNKTAPNRGNSRGDYWVLKLDSSGNRQWDKSFGGDDAEDLHSVASTGDGGYIIGGHSASGASGNKSAGNFGSHDYWVVKLDSGGSRQWDRTYGGDEMDELYGVEATGDGYLLGGISFSALSGNKASMSLGSESGDFWIVKIDGQGNKQAEQSIRGTLSSEVLRLQPGVDGGFMLAGLTGATPGDFELAKLGAPLRFVASSFGAGRVFQTHLTGMHGTNYILQASTNLTSWSAVLTNRAVNGVVSFAHTNPSGSSRRFYRVRQQP